MDKDNNRQRLPIFIGGAPRSGTTFLGDLLGSFSHTAVVPEMQFKMMLLSGADANTADAVKNNFRFKLWGIEGVALDRPSADPAQRIESLVEEFVNLGGRRAFSFWVDHTPDNVRHAEELKKIFPKAKFVHIIRDPRAVIASVLPLSWGSNTAYRAMLNWRKQIRIGLQMEAALPPQDVMRIHYEELIRNPNETIRNASRHFQIDLGDYVGSDRRLVTSYTEDLHPLVGKAPDTSRIDAWKKKLKRRDIEIIEHYVGDLMETLGYARHYPKAQSNGLASREKVEMMTKEFFYRKVNRWKCSRRNRAFLRTGS